MVARNQVQNYTISSTIIRARCQLSCTSIRATIKTVKGDTQNKLNIQKENKTMSQNEMIAMIETMNNYDELAANAKAKADAIREAIKEEMVKRGTEELTAGAYIVRYTSVISNRFDSTTFKRLYAELYKDFTKPVSSRRFSVSY